jgi:AraC-like DNA-binding protein
MEATFFSKIQALANRSEKWLNIAKRYMYNFKDGHFQLPYLPNEPDAMIEGFKKTPFVNFNEETRLLDSNSPFLRAKQNYLNVEPGLWVIATNVLWKVNVKVIAVIDEEPSDYFFVSYSRTSEPYIVHSEAGEKQFINRNQFWTFHKSKIALDAFFKKNSKIFSMMFLFNKTWFEQNIKATIENPNHLVSEMFHSNTAFKAFFYDSIQIHERCNAIYQFIENKKTKEIDLNMAKNMILESINDFFVYTNTIQTETLAQDALKPKDRDRVDKVEKLLNETLTSGFLGIEKIAEELEISPTKLKANFKAVYGESIFQYYQKKQMELSTQMLFEHYSVADIAQQLGYENVSKFSAKFKKTFGVVPSRYF